MDDHVVRPVGTRLLAGASYTIGKRWCESKRCTTQLVPTVGQVVTHADCTCNEERALRYRHLVDTVTSVVDLKGCQASALRLAHALRREGEVARQRAVDYLAGYDGSKLRLLQEAKLSLQGQAIEPEDARVSMFLKDDKYTMDDLKEPRCIQYRSKRLHLYLGRFIHPIEKLLCDHHENGVRVVAKSRNSLDRASDLRSMWDGYMDPMAVLLDHSKFDAHISQAHLELEHMVYSHVNPDVKLAKVLRWQIKNAGRTKNGTKYKVSGTRMSGDVTTGVGNSIINLVMLQTWLAVSGVAGSIYVDGDDSVVVISRSDYHKLDFPWWTTVGMQTKSEVAYEFEHVEFCQCRPVYISQMGHWRMVRNPCRVVTRCPWTTKKYDEAAYQRLTRTIGWCELASNGGVPVLQAYAQWFMDQGEGRLLKCAIRDHLRDRVEHVSVSEPNLETRLSFENAWGISVAEQLVLEGGQFGRLCVAA